MVASEFISCAKLDLHLPDSVSLLYCSDLYSGWLMEKFESSEVAPKAVSLTS